MVSACQPLLLHLGANPGRTRPGGDHDWPISHHPAPGLPGVDADLCFQRACARIVAFNPAARPACPGNDPPHHHRGSDAARKPERLQPIRAASSLPLDPRRMVEDWAPYQSLSQRAACSFLKLLAGYTFIM